MSLRNKSILPALPMIVSLVLLSFVLLQPVAGTASERRPPDCQRCHRVLPEHHPAVDDARQSCLQCHSGHDRKQAGEKSQRKNLHSDWSDRWHPVTVNRLGSTILLTGILGPWLHGLLFLLTFPLRNSSADRQKACFIPERPPLLRCWHAINAVTVVMLGVSGVVLRGLPGDFARLSSAGLLCWHSWLGVFHLCVWCTWLGLKLTGVGRDHGYHPSFGGWVKDSAKQLAYYAWGMFFGHPQPCGQQIFNPLQWMVYRLIMGILLPLVLLSGCGLLFLHLGIASGLWPWRSFLVNIHFLGGCLLIGFLSVHLYLAVWGPGGRLWKRLQRRGGA